MTNRGSNRGPNSAPDSAPDRSTNRSTAHGTGDPTLRVGARIRQRRKAFGLTLEQLASRVGCAKSYLSHIETGHKPPPGPPIVASIARELGLDEASLIEASAWERAPSEIRERYSVMQRDLAGRLASLMGAREGEEGALTGSLDQAHKRGDLRDLLERLREIESGPSGDIAPAPALTEAPLINSVQAGYPTEFTDLGYPARVADEYVRCPDLHDPDAFAARVVGDSMAPAYREGDVVVFSPARTPKDGSDCFVRLEPDHETTFKRVYFERDGQGEETIRLQPINSAYPPRIAPRETVAGLYAAVSVIRMLD